MNVGESRMADKVVIDGIDISGCKFYKSNYTEDFNVRIKHYCSIQGGSCAACSDCDFKQNVQIAKQLEEREQECEELKKRLAIANFEIDSLRDAAHPLSEEYDYYRKFLDEVEEFLWYRLSECKNCIAFSCEKCGQKQMLKILGIINKAKEEH